VTADITFQNIHQTIGGVGCSLASLRDSHLKKICSCTIMNSTCATKEIRSPGQRLLLSHAGTIWISTFSLCSTSNQVMINDTEKVLRTGSPWIYHKKCWQSLLDIAGEWRWSWCPPPGCQEITQQMVSYDKWNPSWFASINTGKGSYSKWSFSHNRTILYTGQHNCANIKHDPSHYSWRGDFSSAQRS